MWRSYATTETTTASRSLLGVLESKSLFELLLYWYSRLKYLAYQVVHHLNTNTRGVASNTLKFRNIINNRNLKYLSFDIFISVNLSFL